MFVCLYVCPSRFWNAIVCMSVALWNAIKAQHMCGRDGGSIRTAYMHEFVCMRLHFLVSFSN